MYELSIWKISKLGEKNEKFLSTKNSISYQICVSINLNYNHFGGNKLVANMVDYIRLRICEPFAELHRQDSEGSQLHKNWGEKAMKKRWEDGLTHDDSLGLCLSSSSLPYKVTNI